jgi:hypothetical protein
VIANCPLEHASHEERRSPHHTPIYGASSFSPSCPFLISLIALTISWNTIDIELYGGMVALVLTAVFQPPCRGRLLCGTPVSLRRLSIPLFASSCPLPTGWFAITNKRSAQPLRHYHVQYLDGIPDGSFGA